MKTFDDLVRSRIGKSGMQRSELMFENGSGVCLGAFYPPGGDNGLWELLVLNSDGSFDDEGWMTPEGITELMEQVQTLPAAEEA